MVPKFKVTEIAPSETLGEKLKKTRENSRLTYDDIEKVTKIRKKYIKAIEEGDYNSLPPDVYMRGFLKNYSKVLRIKESKVLEIYEKERGAVDNIKQAKKTSRIKPLKSPKIIVTPRTFFIILTVLATLAVIGYIIFELLIFSASPKLIISSPSDNAVIKKSFIDIIGKTDEGVEVFINGQKVNTGEEGDFKVNVSIGQKGVNSIKIIARNIKNGKTTEKTTNIIAEISEIAVSSPKPEEAIPNTLKLSLRINPGTAWVSLKKDGENVFEGIMLPGTTRDVEAANSITLTTGNAGSTEVVFNGKSLGKLGNEGEVKTGLVFDKNTKVK